MCSQRSDGQANSSRAYKHIIRAYLLTHEEVASKAQLRAGTSVPAWYINQIGSTDTFYTSLNHNRNYVASKHIIGQRATHDGFWRPEVDDGFLYRDELLAVVLSVAVSELQSIQPERAAALVLRQFEGDSFAALERRLQRNHSLRDALDYTEPEDVPDGTSLWRAFDELAPDDLRTCLQSMCGELLAEHDHAGEFVVIDGTHIAAWTNTRDEIENGDVEGASWGKHEGSFYGYKVFLVVDAASELPVAIVMATGKRNDSAAFAPLIEEFDERYDTDDLQAALADAGFDSQGNREFCHDRLDCPLLTAINPRRSSPLATIKEEIKDLFEDHGEEIDSPYDVLERLPQKQLLDYGVEVGSVEETYIFPAIKERMHRHLPAGVERVFSRLKSFTGLDSRPRTQGDQRRGACRSLSSGAGGSVTDRTATRQTRADTLTESAHLTYAPLSKTQGSPPKSNASQAAGVLDYSLTTQSNFPSETDTSIKKLPSLDQHRRWMVSFRPARPVRRTNFERATG